MPSRRRRNRLTIDRHDARIDRRDALAGAGCDNAGRDIAGRAGWTDGT